ncbi:MAG: hypothetical protein ACTSVI_05730 [Promethearchaeota archaeon]
MGVGKNLLMGIIYASIAAVIYIILPWTGIQAVKNLDLGGITINYFREGSYLNKILFYIEALGIVQVGLGFAKGTSPGNSKRKAIFSIAQIFGSGIYMYIIKFSGLSRIPISIENFGEITVTFDALMYMGFGIVLMNMLLSIFDLIIVIYRQKTGFYIDKDKLVKQERISSIANGGRGVQ